MKFIELADGLSVNLESVEMIQRTSPTETAIMVRGEVYTVGKPYEALRIFLSTQDATPIEEALKKLVRFSTRTVP